MAKAKTKTLTDKQIVDQIAKKTQDAVGFSATNIANKQEEALKLYNREALPGDSKIKGRSKWVDSSVLKHTEWLRASVARVFASVYQVVKFFPVEASDEALARQQTIVANHLATVENSHETYLDGWVFNGALFGLGIVTLNYDKCRKEGMPELIKGVTDQQLVEYDQQEQDGKIVIEEAGEPYDAPLPHQAQQAMQALPQLAQQNPQIAQALPKLAGMLKLPQVRDLKIRRVTEYRKLTINNLPPEDFIVSKDATFDQQTGGIKAALQGHKRVMAREDLIEHGFDPEKVKKIPLASDDDTGVALERSEPTDYDQGVGDTNNDVTVYEVFTKMAIVGDKRRHYRLTLGGDLDNSPVLLNYEEVSEFYPYCAFVPFTVGNTLFGHGIADRVGDDQILLSKIGRSEIDNLNLANNPIKIINQAVTNMDDALNLFPGSAIRSEAPDGGIRFLQTPVTAGSANGLKGDLRQEQDFTTGVGATTMGVDPAATANVTATAASQQKNTANLLIEHVCRNFAATGYKYLFRVIIDLLNQFPEDAEQLTRRIMNAEYVPVDRMNPWMDIRSQVPYGVMNRDFNLMTQNQNLAMLQQAKATGAYWITDQHLYNTMAKIIENGGDVNIDAYMGDPSKMPPPPPPPPPVDPNAGLIEIEKVKAQLKAEAEQRDYEFEWRKFIAEQDMKRDQMAQDLYLQEAEIKARYGAQVDIARIQAEQAAQRNDVDFAIAQQTAQVQAEADHKKALAEIEAKQKQTDAAIAQAMQPQQTGPQPGPIGGM